METSRVTPERLRRIRELFDQALDHEPAEREAFLTDAASGDDALRDEVQSLLRALADSDDRLEHPAVDVLEAVEDETEVLVGRRVGPYEVVRLIGHGGMGSVYEAVRADQQFRKRVAIKFLRSGYEGELAVRRFRHERQILAGLDHPNIAGLLDGGVTHDGLPYFVMEYVEGEPLCEYCDTRGLSVQERLTLFRQVCGAVQYAHQRLVVHRDLKPSNILVTRAAPTTSGAVSAETGEGTVKLLDFGIAKLLGEEAQTDDVPVTRGGARLLTPGYASPEQIRGLPITTASDVYSLGVVLFELLAGRRPFSLDGALFADVERAVAEVDPPRPSSVVTDEAAARRGERGAARLRAQLAGDLDGIVLMALRQEPERRYGSAAQLSEDLQRYLDGKPVRARRDWIGYRARKFARRHRVEVAAAVLVLASLVGGIVGIARQARRAEVERARAEHRYREGRRLANALLFELHDAIADLPGATAVRGTLVKRALEYLDGLANDVGHDPSLDIELALAYQRIGDVQGNPTNANLGDTEGARATYGKALALAERTAAARPTDYTAQHTLAVLHERLADVLAPTAGAAAAVRHQRAALALYGAIAAAHPGDAEARHALAVSHLKLGDLLGHPAFVNLGDRAGAMTEYREALALLEAQAESTTDRYRNRRYRALVQERVGRLEQEDGDLKGALTMLQRSLVLREALAGEQPSSVNARRDVAINHYLICDLYLSLGDGDAALESCRRSLAVRQALYDADRRNTQLVRGMALVHRRLAHVMTQRGQPVDAIAHLRESVGFYDAMLGAGGGMGSDRRDLAHALAELCALQTGASARDRGATPARATCERARDALLDLGRRETLTKDDSAALARVSALTAAGR